MGPSLFSSGSSTCSFPLWRPTKSSTPVSKPIKTGFDKLLIFVQNNQNITIGYSKSNLTTSLPSTQMISNDDVPAAQNPNHQIIKKNQIGKSFEIRNRSFH